MPVVVAAVDGGNGRLEQRVALFLRFLSMRAANLGYVQLDSADQRPIYVHAEGITVDPRWARLGSGDAGTPSGTTG